MIENEEPTELNCYCDEHGSDLCYTHRTHCTECGRLLPSHLMSDTAKALVTERTLEEQLAALKTFCYEFVRDNGAPNTAEKLLVALETFNG